MIVWILHNRPQNLVVNSVHVFENVFGDFNKNDVILQGLFDKLFLSYSQNNEAYDNFMNYFSSCTCRELGLSCKGPPYLCLSRRRRRLPWSFPAVKTLREFILNYVTSYFDADYWIPFFILSRPWGVLIPNAFPSRPRKAPSGFQRCSCFS